MKKRIVITLLIFIVLISTALYWLCYTQSGLSFVLAQLKHIPKVDLKIDNVSGTLAGPLHIDYFELDNERVHVVARQIDLDLNPALLASGWIMLHGSIDQIEVALKHYNHSTVSNGPVNFLPSFLHIYASSLNIHHATFTHYNGFNIQAAPLTTQLTLSRRHLALDKLDVQGEWFAAQGTFKLDSGTELTLDSQLDAILKPTHSTALRGNVIMNGSTKILNFVADIQQPNHAHTTATLSFPNNAWLIKGHLYSERWLLTPWLEKATLSFSNGDFDYTFDDAGIHANGNVIVPEWATSPLHVDADARYAKRVIELKRADISDQASHIQTRTVGSITLTDNASILDLQSTWQYLQWPLQMTTQQTYFRSQHGIATLKGGMPYQFKVDAQLSVVKIPDSHLQASGTLDSKRIDITQFDWQVLAGSLQGKAQLAFTKPRQWQFDMSAHDVRPSSLFAQLPGQISFVARGSGDDFDLNSAFDVSVRSIDGVLRKQNIHGQGRIAHHASNWLADHVDINWGNTTLTLNGGTGDDHDLRWHVNAPALQQIDPEVQGQLVMDGSLQGTHDKPQLSLNASSTNLTYANWKINSLALDTRVDLSDQTPSHVSLSAKQLSHDDYVLSQLAVNAQGLAASHDLTLRGVIDTPVATHQQVLIDLHGQYERESATEHDGKQHINAYTTKWTGQLSRFDVQGTQLHAALDHPTQLSVLYDAKQILSQLTLQTLCLNVDKGHACISGDWQNNSSWQAHAAIDKLPLTLEHAVDGAVTRLTATVDAKMDLHQSPNQPWLANAQLAMSDAAIRYQIAGHDEVWPLTEGTAQINADSHAINANAELQLASDTAATLTLQANRIGGAEISNLPLHGNISLHSADAKLVPVFVHEVDRAAGTLMSEINIAGSLGSPTLNGTLQLNKGELDLYKWNLALRELQLNAQLNGEQVQFTAQGNAGQGSMNLNGNFDWRNGLSGNLQLHGDNLLVADSPEYHVTATPNLTFAISNANSKDNIEVSGEVLIPTARLKPQTITNAVRVSPDAHFKDDAIYERNSEWLINSNVTVRLGDDVRFDGLGLQGQLAGEVNTRLHSGAVASGHGELSINDGHYEAYGRKLDIKRGRLLFDNTPLENPGLDIQAERVIHDVTQGDITVGAYVRGVLRDPRLEFYSDPSMTQTQIVSYLVVGKPLDQLQGQETTTVRSATSSLALQGGGYLAAQLGRRIGLEDVGVETDANNQSALVLGKFLSPRLYISYGISLTQAVNTLKLRYAVSKHWTIKTEAGEARSADVEYRIEH